MDCKNFIYEFLTKDQLVMLGQNKRNMVTFVVSRAKRTCLT